MLPNHFRCQDEVDGINRSVYEIRTEDGCHVARLDGEPIGKLPATESISAKSDSWQIAHEVCAAIGADTPVWCEHDKDVIFVGFSRESIPG